MHVEIFICAWSKVYYKLMMKHDIGVYRVYHHHAARQYSRPPLRVSAGDLP